MDKKISVIVPIYKVEPYLRRCIDSIINQTYNNLEIILVDDGSTDGCPRICDEYAGTDKRIKVIHKENGGLSSARNAGLDIATGDYIAFADSDDWLDISMYENLYKTAVSSDSDITTCGIIYHNNSSERGSSANDGRVIEWRKHEAIEKLIDPIYNIRFEVWNKLFKSELVKDVRFKVGQVFEDVYFDRIVFLRSNKITTLNLNLYNYRVSRPGNTNSTFKEVKLQIFNELDDFRNDLIQLGYKEVAYSYLCYAVGTCISFYLEVKRLENNPVIINRILNQYKILYSKLLFKTKIRKPNYIMFRFSPSLYCVLRGALR